MAIANDQDVDKARSIALEAMKQNEKLLQPPHPIRDQQCFRFYDENRYSSLYQPGRLLGCLFWCYRAGEKGF